MFTTINSYCFNYILLGDRQKPVIFFLHGFMGDCNDFSRVIPYLSDFCCLAVDLPGHGKTEVNGDAHYRMPQLAQAITMLLKHLQIKHCCLVGYSMGGRLALYLAIYFPQYFSGVILESASPGLKTQLERDRRIAQDLKLVQELESGNLAQFVQRWYTNSLFNSFTQQPNYPEAIARRLDNNPYKLAKPLRYMGLGVQPSLWNNLAEAEVPLILLVGELDRKFVAINQKMANYCSLARLSVVKNCGHNIHFEQPKKISDSIIYLTTAK